MVAIPFYSILSSALCLWASSAEAFLCPFTFFLPKVWWDEIFVLPLHPQSEKGAFSSVGLEHLPYKQRVGGSNPSTPTSKRFVFDCPFQYASFENVRDRCPVYSMAAYGSAMCWLGSVCFCYAEALSALSSLALPPLFSFFFPF